MTYLKAHTIYIMRSFLQLGFSHFSPIYPQYIQIFTIKCTPSTIHET